jgi:hypothetical protein
MKRIILLLAIASFVFPAEASLQLENWAGKYPVNEDPQFKSILLVPEVRHALTKMLSPAEKRLLTQEYSAMSQIDMIHGCLVVKVCRPHWCPSDNAMLVIDLQREQFHVGFYLHREHVTVMWVSSEGDIHDLPKEIQDAFYYMHHPM